MNREELKEMINYGASEIFRSNTGTITNEEIDDLLKRGEERTRKQEAEINNAIKDSEGNILDLGMASINIYEFEGSNYLEKKREDEAALVQAYYQNLEKTLGSRRSLKTDPFAKEERKIFFIKPKIIRLPEYHFYQEREKLLDLLNKEAELKANCSIIRRDNGDMDDELPDEETDLKEKLLGTGMADWTKNDFHNFMRGCERFGRERFDKIQQVTNSLISF